MVDIAALGLSVDSGKVEEGVKRLDALVASAAKAEAGTKSLGSMSLIMGQQLNTLIQIQMQQTAALVKMVEQQDKAAKAAEAGQKAYGGLYQTMRAGSSTLSGTSSGMVELARSSETAWKAAEKLDDQFDSVWKSMGVGTKVLSEVSKEMETLQRVTGQSTDSILSLNRAIDQTALTSDQKAVAFTRLNAIISDTTGQMEGYRKRLEQYVGTLEGQNAGEVASKLVSALARTQDGAQKTADALNLLGVQGADALKKLAETGAKIYTTELKELDKLQGELFRRNTMAERAEKQAKEAADKIRAELGVVGRFINDNPVLDALFNPMGATTGGIKMVNRAGSDLYKAVGLDSLEKLFTFTDKMKVELALVSDDADRVYKSYEVGLPKVVGFFDALYTKAKGYVDIIRGTYKPQFTSTYALTDFDPFGTPSSTTPTAPPIPETYIKAGQQFTAQFDSARAATLRFNEVQKTANDLFKKGAISAEDMSKALYEAGQAYTRVTGAANPYIEQLKASAAEQDAIAAAAVADRQKVIDKLDADIAELRKKAQTWTDMLSGALPGGTRPLVRRRENDAKFEIMTADDRRRLEADVQAAEEAGRLLQELLRDMEISAANSRVPEAVQQQIKALQQQTKELEITAEAYEKYGTTGERMAQRTVAIFRQIQKEAGDLAASEFLKSGAIPAKLQTWVEAFDASAIQKARTEAEKFLATQRELVKQQEGLADAIESGDKALADYTRSQIAVTEANKRGFSTFEDMKRALGDIGEGLVSAAQKMHDMAIATNAARTAAEAMKRADLSGAIASMGAMSSIDRREGSAVLQGQRDIEALPTDMGEDERIRAVRSIRKRVAAEVDEIRNGIQQGIANFDWDNTWDKAFASFNRRFAAADSVTRERMQALSSAARELNNRNMGAEAIKVLEGRMKDLSPAAAEVVKQLKAVKDIEIAGEMARAARDTNLEVRAMERLAEAAGKGEAAMRAAARANAIERERAIGGRDISAAEIAKEVAFITQATNEYRGAAVQAQAVAAAYFAAIDAGATSSAELSTAQEELNIKLRIGEKIQGDSAQMAALRTQKIKEQTDALKAQQRAEGDKQIASANADLARELEFQKAVTAEIGKRGAGLAAVQVAYEQNEAALRFYKTTFDALALSEDAEDKKRATRIQQYVQMSREMKQQAVIQGEMKRTQQGQDELALLRTEISLIGKTREERETVLALAKLELEFKEKSIGLDQEAINKLREQIDLQKQQVPDRIKLGLKKSDLEQEAQLTQEIWKNAIAGIQSSFSSFFENVLTGGTSSWRALADSLKRTMFQVIAQITAAMVFRPIIGGALNMVGASTDFMRSMGLGSYASGAGSASGGGGGDWLGTAGNLFSIGNNASQIAGGGSLFSGAANWLGFGGSAAASFSAVPAASTVAAPAAALAVMEGGGVAAGSGLLGTSGAAGVAGTTGIAASGFAAAIPYIGLAIAAISLIVSFLGNKKPSNKGAEFSFNLDEDFTTQFEGTKHQEQMEFVRGFAQPIQSMVTGFEKLYGVVRRPDATIGTNFGIKEGSSFFYDAGPRDGGIEGRQVFKFDPEDKASIQAALDQLMIAFLKDADWSALGDRLGKQAAADVATALENSAATTLTELMADISFASSFDELAKLGSGALDGTALAIRKLEEAGRESAKSITTSAQEFFQKAQDLKLGTEEMGDGLTRADFATKGYIMTLLGMETNLSAVEAAGLQANAFMEELTPLLKQFGFSLEEIADITESVTARMEAAARQADAAFTTSMDTMYYQAIYGSGYQMPSDTLVYQNAGYKFPGLFGPGGGTFAPLVGAIDKARTGDAAALLDVKNRLAANTNKTINGLQVMTQQEASAIYAQVTQWYEAAINAATAANQNQNRDPLFGQDQGGGDSGTDNSALIDTLNEQRATTMDLIRTLEGTANTFGRLAKSLDDYRKSLLLNDSLTTLTPSQQLAEARSQYQDALTRSRSSNQEVAAEGMNDLREASSNLLDKSRNYWASSINYQEDFAMVQKDLLEITGKARSIEQQALDQLVTANATLKNIETDLANLQGTPSTGNPGGGGTPTTPSNPAPGYTSGSAVTGAPAGMTFLSSAFPHAAQGILFGVGSLGRSTTQNTAAFMAARFPKYTGEMTEYAAYQWMQGAHESGLKSASGDPLSRNAYYAAASKGGYSGAFGAGQHQGYLNADLTGGAWMRFITELRGYTGAANLKPGWFWPNGAADLPAGMNQQILTFAKGGVFTSPTMLRMADGRLGLMAEAGPEAVMPLARTRSGRMGIEVASAANDNQIRELRAMLRLQAEAFGRMIDLMQAGNRQRSDIERKTGRQSFDGVRRRA